MGEEDPICPWRLANLLDFNVVDLSEFEHQLPEQVATMRLCTGPKGFSALTLFPNENDRLVILNDGHGIPRQAADLAHELAHGLLMHSPENFGHGGRGKVDKICEAEASWLGPTLLVPGRAALRIVRQKMGVRAAAHFYGVSEELVEMRLQVTGARRRVRS